VIFVINGCKMTSFQDFSANNGPKWRSASVHHFKPLFSKNIWKRGILELIYTKNNRFLTILEPKVWPKTSPYAQFKRPILNIFLVNNGPKWWARLAHHFKTLLAENVENWLFYSRFTTKISIFDYFEAEIWP